MAIDIKPRWAWAGHAVRTVRGQDLIARLERENPSGGIPGAIVRAEAQIAAPSASTGRVWTPYRGGVFIHHAGPRSFTPQSDDDCLQHIGDIWHDHYPKFGGDIAYNFIVCQHGNIFTGRGYQRGEANGGDAPATPNTRQGEVWVPGEGAVGRNAGFYSVLGLIREQNSPTSAMLDAMKRLIGHLRGPDVSPARKAGPHIFPHRHGDNTVCPGNLTPYAQNGSRIDPGGSPAAPTVSIVPRAQWGARPPRTVTRVELADRTGFAVHYSAGPHTQSVRAIQNYHMDGRDWPDIGYNFLVDRAGRVYEGRGWTSVGAHATGYNTSHIGVCFIGSDGDATPHAKAAIRALYYRARHLSGKALIATYHGAIGSTACPGADLRTWVIGGMAAADIPIGGGDGGGPATGLTGETSVRSITAQQRAVNFLGHQPPLELDGSFGPLTLAGVKWAQRKIGVAADGLWGPLTEAAYVTYIGPGRPGGGVIAYRSVRAQQSAVNRLGHTPRLELDDNFGPLTLAGVKWLQRKIGVDPDGNWGPATEKAYLAYTGDMAGSGGGGITTIRPVVSQQHAVNFLGHQPPLELDGSFGPLTESGVKWAQRKIGVDPDGMWGPATEAAYGRWTDGERLELDGNFGPATIAATQRAIGVTPDGSFGPESKRAFQRHLNTWASAGLVIDGSTGPATVKALQRHLNAMIRAGLDLDGSWGPGTTRALQSALNQEKF
ncbi:peptidoglycan recognition protein family protein [Streptomyces bacillaris]|uniref:peptidoglycan recognition protein family protein n=1 Tax=Streptomyces bacillaris TaxID=68179 RepID=UPI003EB7C5B6